jgi:hypothetical protein
LRQTLKYAVGNQRLRSPMFGSWSKIASAPLVAFSASSASSGVVTRSVALIPSRSSRDGYLERLDDFEFEFRIVLHDDPTFP